jgi:hypothetical protein
MAGMDLLRWLRRKVSKDRDSTTGTSARGAKAQPLTEGVYAGPGTRKHYALDGQTRTLCGGSAARLHRWGSAWYVVERKERCQRCDALVGDRGNEPHGERTPADLILFGLEIPAHMSRSEREMYEELRESHERRQAAEPSPPPLGATFDDPPFVYAEDPLVTRLRVHQPELSRVLNDVYARNPNGKKWHRVYMVGRGGTNGRLARYGRSMLLVCGGAAHEFVPDEGWVFSPTPLRTDIPPPVEVCKLCRQSDAKYGRGEIPNTLRWDR